MTPSIPTLYLVSTPIGNLGDVTDRAKTILSQVNTILCEDTRVTLKLLSLLPHHQSTLIRLDENTQTKMIPQIINLLAKGKSLAMVTDAGTPTISDPGYKIVDAVYQAGFFVDIVPGASSLTAAIAVSGLNAAKVWFTGFLPSKKSHRQKLYPEMFRQLTNNFSTLIVFFASPHRLIQTLTEISQLTEISHYRVIACKELTKIHQQVIRGDIHQVLSQISTPVKGEWVILIGR